MQNATNVQTNVWIPEIDDRVLGMLSVYIRPVVDGRYVRPRDIYNDSFLHDYVKGKIACNLVKLDDIKTCHSFQGDGSIFTPKAAEVLAAIPKRHTHDVVAYEIIEEPDSAEQLTEEAKQAFDDGYHTATVRLYSKRPRPNFTE